MFIGAVALILMIASKSDLDRQGFSACTFSVVMPKSLNGSKVKDLADIVMQDDMLRSIQKGLPEYSRNLITVFKKRSRINLLDWELTDIVG